MDYEKRIREYLNNADVDELYKSMLLNLFPELKESEGEKIRKEIINFIYDKTNTYELRERSNSWLAWCFTFCRFYRTTTNRYTKNIVRCIYNDNLKSHAYDNPIDACYEMIIKLHKLNLL